MEKGREVAFLRQRHGFVKLAMQQGVSIVPCFAFGQSSSYAWWKPGPPFVPKHLIQKVSLLCACMHLAAIAQCMLCIIAADHSACRNAMQRMMSEA